MSKIGLLGDLIGRLIKAGYPESTAVKIATGELPMDQASRMARAQDQGFTEKMYHTGAYSDNPKGILEINPSVDSWGAGSGGETGTFFASHPEVSASYTDSNVASRPTSYPMLINTRGMEKINADGENWNTIYNPAVVDPDGQQVMEVLSGMDGEYLQPIFKDEYVNTNELAIGARRRMATGSVIDNVVDVGPNGIAFNASIKANNPHEYPHEWVQDYERKGGKIISLQDGSQARSELAAAFDPDQIHSTNILASNPAAGVGAAGLGLLAMGASDDSEAGVLGKAAKGVIDSDLGYKQVNPSNPFLFDFNPNKLTITEKDFKDVGSYKGDASKPITVTKSGDSFVILDGHHRAKIAQQNGNSVRAIVIPDKEVSLMRDENIHPAEMLKEWIALKAQGGRVASKPVAGVGAGVLGAIGASQSNKTYADYSPANLARLRSNDVGSIQAPQSMAASNIAGLMGSANKVGYDDSLLGMVAPQLPSELMNKIAYNDKRGLMDYAKAYAGLLGF